MVSTVIPSQSTDENGIEAEQQLNSTQVTLLHLWFDLGCVVDQSWVY